MQEVVHLAWLSLGGTIESNSDAEIPENEAILRPVSSGFINSFVTSFAVPLSRHLFSK